MGESNQNKDFLDFEISTDFVQREEFVKSLEKRLNESSLYVREALIDFQPQADEFQQEVIEAQENTIRVLAPAGSGKTQTMINRVLHQVRQGMRANRILMLTFDNAAVGSIQEKLNEQTIDLDIEFESPTIQTLNAFGYSILRTHFPDENRPVINRKRQFGLLREIIDGLTAKHKYLFSALPSNIKYKFYLDFFSLLKNEIFDPRSLVPQDVADFMLNNEAAQPFFVDAADSKYRERVIQSIILLFQAYQFVLDREKQIDFDDQKLRSYVCLKDNGETLKQIRNKYSEIIVDEFQDINKLDFELIKLIARDARLIVTGDDDQAIYGFRGCSPKYILELEKHLGRPVTEFTLRTNYRSPKNIVDHATKLIRHNTWRKEKNPIPNITSSATVTTEATKASGLEAKFILKYIQKISSQKQLSYDNFAILYRTNAQSLPLQVEFILNDIPYYVRDEDNIIQNETLEHLLGFLRLKLAIEDGNLPQPKDAVHSVKAYFRFVNERESRSLTKLFQEHRNYFDAIQSEEFFQILPKARASNISKSTQQAIEANKLLQTFDILAANFNGLQGMIGSLEDVAEHKVPLGEIYELAANFKGNTREFSKTLSNVLDRARSKNAGKDQDNGVGLLTYFRSKGRQWHTVILVSCNDGLIPHKLSNVEEERRLFYVALTRATSNLMISYVTNVSKNNVTPSRFLTEAGLI